MEAQATLFLGMTEETGLTTLCYWQEAVSAT